MARKLRFRLREPNNGTVEATVLVPTTDGRYFRIVARTDLAALDQAARQMGIRFTNRSFASGQATRRAGERFEVGAVGFSFKKLAKKISKLKALKVISKIATNPIFKSLIPPQIAMAISATEAATKAIKAAKKGSREAKAAIRTAFEAAKAGDPIAKAALNNAQKMTGVQLRPSEGGAGRVLRVQVLP